jgi:hypothetical protein
VKGSFYLVFRIANGVFERDVEFTDFYEALLYCKTQTKICGDGVKFRIIESSVAD